MRLPPSEVYDYERHSGAWFELRDAEGRVLYRRVTPIPIAQDLEAPSGDSKRPFTHVEAEQRGTFVLSHGSRQPCKSSRSRSVCWGRRCRRAGRSFW
jgi:hypothetical protein